MQVATVRDLIKALQKFPMDAPVFGYSFTDECDFPIQVAALEQPYMYHGEPYPRHGCQGDSHVQEYWEQTNQVCDVVYVRPRAYNE